MVPDGYLGDGPCPRASGRHGTGDGAVSDRTSSGLTSRLQWSPRRPSRTGTSSSRSVRAVAPSPSRWPGAACASSRWNGTPSGPGTCGVRPYDGVRTGSRSSAATRGGTGCRASPSAPPGPSRSAPRPHCCGTCSTTRALVSSGPISSSSGKWRASGRRCRPPRCSPPHGRPGGPSWPARRIPAAAFRPVPAVDAAVLTVERRTPPLLPGHLAPAYGEFVRRHWR